MSKFVGALLALAVLGRSTWDGVYSKAQANRGRDLYNTQCLECHGSDLMGDPENPPLTTPAFVYKWNSLTVGDLFERVHRDMPPDKRGTLTRRKAADLVAFILSYNGFPSGDGELPPDLPALREIRFDAERPEHAK